jgi:hypothetical protein
MRFSARYQGDAPLQDDKQGRICDFIRRYLRAGGDCPRTVLVVARSAKSPVLQALHSVVRDGIIPGIDARIVIADDDAGPVAGDRGELACDVRIANNPRLLDAHEQLIVGDATWYGDSMRRDPMKRDAFECFVANDLVAARRARATFDNLWHSAGLLPAREADMAHRAEGASLSR